MLSFVEAFWVMAGMFFLMIPFVFILRPPKHGKGRICRWWQSENGKEPEFNYGRPSEFFFMISLKPVGDPVTS